MDGWTGGGGQECGQAKKDVDVPTPMPWKEQLSHRRRSSSPPRGQEQSTWEVGRSRGDLPQKLNPRARCMYIQVGDWARANGMIPFASPVDASFPVQWAQTVTTGRPGLEFSPPPPPSSTKHLRRRDLRFRFAKLLPCSLHTQSQRERGPVCHRHAWGNFVGARDTCTSCADAMRQPRYCMRCLPTVVIDFQIPPPRVARRTGARLPFSLPHDRPIKRRH